MKIYEREFKIFKKHGGFLSTGQAARFGIRPGIIYSMASEGILEQVTRGLYRLSKMPLPENFDLITVAMKVPKGVVCLISALSFHDITTQIPHEVHLAVKRPTIKPRVAYPPTHFYWMSEPAFSSGIETHLINGVEIKIYTAAKTVADCFKFRNSIGFDIAIESLKLCRFEKKCTVDELLKYAKICRVEKIMTPYLEALL